MSKHKRRLADLRFFKPGFDRTQVVAEMTITILKNGQTKVTGPLGNKRLCMAILEDAANVIKTYSPQSEAEEKKPDAGIIVEQPKIILPSA